MQPGRNRLLIQVDNRRRPDRVPMHHFDWANDGGLYRSVALIPLPQCFIRRFSAALAPDGLIAIRMQLSESDGRHWPGGQYPESGDFWPMTCRSQAGSGEATITANPDLLVAWMRLRLYDVQVSFGADRLADRVGFRDIRVQGHDIHAERKIPLSSAASACMRTMPLLGKATNDADIRRRFTHAKELGCNCPPPGALSASRPGGGDRRRDGPSAMGGDTRLLGHRFCQPGHLRRCREPVAGTDCARHQPCVHYHLGVGNENADTDARYAFMSRLAQAARQADPSRLVGAACLINRERFAIEDRLADHLDIIGLNEYFGWYEPDFTGLQRLLANSRPNRPGGDQRGGCGRAGRAPWRSARVVH